MLIYLAAPEKKGVLPLNYRGCEDSGRRGHQPSGPAVAGGRRRAARQDWVARGYRSTAYPLAYPLSSCKSLWAVGRARHHPKDRAASAEMAPSAKAAAKPAAKVAQTALTSMPTAVWASLALAFVISLIAFFVLTKKDSGKKSKGKRSAASLAGGSEVVVERGREVRRSTRGRSVG